MKSRNLPTVIGVVNLFIALGESLGNHYAHATFNLVLAAMLLSYRRDS